MEHDPEIWNNLGVAYGKKGDFEKAIEIYKKGLSIDNEYPVLFCNLGNVYYTLSLKTKDPKIFQKSIQNYKKAIEIDPDYPTPYSGLGMAYRQAGNLDGAIYCWKKALELRPDFGQALYNLGLVYLEKGDKDKALDYLNKYKENYYNLLPLGERKKLETLIQKIRQNL